jgi:uroporphyrinogen-III decarboxylase
MIQSGIERPFLTKHPVKTAEDYHIAEYIIERAEPIVQSERIYRDVERVGDGGFVVPLMRRIPFQQILLEYLGEEDLIYALADNPELVQRLLTVLDFQFTEILHKFDELQVPYIEFCDNIEGSITSPRIYSEYCLPYHQKYVEILHNQGKKVGSHTDGNLKPLLKLLAESGLDVCESFTPAPITACTFEEAWNAWDGHPTIWGGIPSVLLEPQTSQEDFERFINKLFETIKDRPIILGIGDMALPETILERLQWISKLAEQGAA